MPIIGLSKDAFAEGFSGEPAVSIVCDFKDDLIHAY
jgi:hypothetical protein